jgi:hypothetical protein
MVSRKWLIKKGNFSPVGLGIVFACMLLGVSFDVITINFTETR